MESYSDIANRIREYFQRKYPKLTIREIDFTTKHQFDPESSEVKERFEIQYWFDFEEEDEEEEKSVALFWPYTVFESSISFENAFQKSKTILAAFVKAQEEDM